jgi:demethylmenaquinone methyltransferase/2-methoxy-6-polyprenyl-1,4-benzoquinol methylase
MPLDLVRRTYDARAPFYDAIVRVLSFGGDRAYRRAAVDELRLRPGQRVLDVGCGTGLNFRLIADAVGPDGLVVGTDLSRGMLARVSGRPRMRLVQAAANQRLFRPASFDAVLCTYVISTILDEQVLPPILEALRPGGRLVVVDDTLPPGWFVGPGFMLRTLLRRGWPDLKRDTVRAVAPHLDRLRVRFVHYGMIFIISGDRR